MDAPLDSWEQWRRGTPASGFDPSTRSFSNNIADYGQTMNARYTDGHATSSLARVKAEDIERSTKIVSVEAASHLAGYEDPIKLVLPPVLQEANVVYVKRKYAVGNTATEVPERAPAPVVSVQEETRRVTLRRYGGDIDFNVNACAVPDMFKKEMDLKVGAQHAALADRLVALGYETLIREGTDFTSALVRSNTGLDEDIQNRARRFYFQQVFGALSTSPYPIHNLLAAAKRCTAYDISKSLKSVLILPHGVPEMMAYARAENMKYEINGIAGPQGKPITMKVENGYKIPATTASVFVHIPPALHLHGSAAPVAGQNALEEVVQVYHTYAPSPTVSYGSVFNRSTFDYPAAPANYDAAGTTYGLKDLSQNYPYYCDIMDRTYRCLGDHDAGLLYSFKSKSKIAANVGPILLDMLSEVLANPTRDKAVSYLTLFQLGNNSTSMVQKIASAELNTMHAILATPGEETGNLLMQYPRSTVSADASTESGRMQLRVYMGAVLKRPENVLVMRNVAFNGIRNQRILGCVKDDEMGIKLPPLVEDKDFNDNLLKIIRHQPCLFPSIFVIHKLSSRASLPGIGDKFISFTDFLEQMKTKDSARKLIEKMTNLTVFDPQVKIPQCKNPKEDRFKTKIDVTYTVVTGTDATAKTYACVGDNENLLFADCYPEAARLRTNKNLAGTGDQVLNIDVCSSILRAIMLHSSDEALDDQRQLDQELNVNEELSEMYLEKVVQLRDQIIEKVDSNKFSGVAGRIFKGDSPQRHLAPFSRYNTDAQTGIDYYKAITTNDPIIPECNLSFNRKGQDITIEQMEHESSMNWLHYLCAKDGFDLDKTNYDAYKDIIGSYDSFYEKLMKAEPLKERCLPGINCPDTVGGDVKTQKEGAGNINDAIKNVDPDLENKADEIINHMNQLMLDGLEWSTECAQLLYLFCLVTEQRNKAMDRESYRFMQGGEWNFPSATNVVDEATKSVDKLRCSPLQPTVSDNGTLNVSKSNLGQFKNLDDLNNIDKFTGMAIQKYDVPQLIDGASK